MRLACPRKAPNESTVRRRGPAPVWPVNGPPLLPGSLLRTSGFSPTTEIRSPSVWASSANCRPRKCSSASIARSRAGPRQTRSLPSSCPAPDSHRRAGASGKGRDVSRAHGQRPDREGVRLGKGHKALMFLDVQWGRATSVRSSLGSRSIWRGLTCTSRSTRIFHEDRQEPGTVIGSMNDDDINYTTSFLAGIVQRTSSHPNARDSSLHAEHAAQLQRDPPGSTSADRDRHGRLGKSVAQTWELRAVIYPEPIQFTASSSFIRTTGAKRAGVS